MNDLNKYRVTMIYDLRNYAEPVETLIEKMKALLETLGAKVEKTENLGVKDFVRVTDRRLPNAPYAQFEIEAPSSLPVAFREKLRLDRSVKRIFVQSI